MKTRKQKPAPASSPNGQTATALLTSATKLAFAGRTYNLVMTNGALIEFEQLTGLSILMDGEKVFNRPTLHALSAMLFVLLKRDGCTMTQEVVTDRLTQDQIQPAYRAILAARLASFTTKDKGDPTNPSTISPS
jgi:hypothetical protein